MHETTLILLAASINYFYFGGDLSSTLLLVIMGSKRTYFHHSGHKKTSRRYTRFVSRYLWRETADHLFEDITSKVCFDKDDILMQKIQPSDFIARETSLLFLFHDMNEMYYISTTFDSGRTFKKQYVSDAVQEKLERYNFYSSVSRYKLFKSMKRTKNLE